MNSLLVCVALTLITQVPDASKKAVLEPELQPFRSAEDRFRIAFPGTPEAQKEESETELGKAAIRIYLVEKSTSEALGVVVTDYPADSKLFPEKVFDSTRDELLAGVKGTLLDSRVIKLQGHPGRAFEYEFTIKGGVKLKAWTRLYLVRHRVYQIGVMGSDDVAQSSLARRVHDSFLIEEPAKAGDQGKLTIHPKKKPTNFESHPSSKAMRDDADRAAKLDKQRTEQSTLLKNLREQIEKTQIPEDERQQIWLDDRSALDRAIWEAYFLFDPETEYKLKADYLDKKQAEYRGEVIKAYKITKETLTLIRQEGTLDMWEIPKYPACDWRKAARELDFVVHGIEGEDIYHRATCLILTSGLEKPDAKEVKVKLYKALTNRDVRPCPKCFP